MSKFKYTAFISYNSRDNKTAKWLQARLEKYNMPSVIVNEKGDIIRSYDKKPKFRIFRYVTDLVAQNLNDGLRTELDHSKFLIVICSPNSANAPWVRKEVKYFIDSGRKKQIIPFVIDGIPYSNGEDECFTPELKDAFPDGSALGVSLNDVGDDLWILRKRKAVAKIASLLIDLPNAYDYIWNRHKINLIKSVLLHSLLAFFLAGAVLLLIHTGREFDISIDFVEAEINPQLVSVGDVDVTITLDGKTQKGSIDSLSETMRFRQIPGELRGEQMKMTVKSAGFIAVDTTVTACENVKVVLYRNHEWYGKVDVEVLYRGNTLYNETVMFEGVACRTDNEGRLKIDVPFSSQKKNYEIEYMGCRSVIKMPCSPGACVEID